MKATGIIRRVDDLGRVVIPKEIRRSQHIKEGDPLEIFVTDCGVMFAPYKPKNLDSVAQDWLNEHKTIIDKTYPKFSIYNKTITCEAIVGGYRMTGEAKCDPRDTFSPAVGMVYAWCRATKHPIPSELD